MEIPCNFESQNIKHWEADHTWKGVWQFTWYKRMLALGVGFMTKMVSTEQAILEKAFYKIIQHFDSQCF